MLSLIMRQVPQLRTWATNPATLLERFLDHLDKLSRFILPASADNPAYRHVEADTRRRRLRD